MGVDEDAHPISYEEDGTKVIFKFADGTFSKDRYPNYEFVVDTVSDGTFAYGSDEVFFKDNESKGNPIFTISYNNASFVEIVHATSKDIKELIKIIKQKIKEKYDIDIQEEVKLSLMTYGKESGRSE